MEGILFKDIDLRKRAEQEGRNLDELRAQEAAAMALPPKFATFSRVSEEEMEVEAELMIAKVKWELRAREERAAEREEEGQDGGGKWTEEWGKKQQKEKEVYCEATSTIDFANRRVTDIPTCRRTIPPQSLPAQETAILTNLKSPSRLGEVTKTFIRDKCDQNGNLKINNITRRRA